MLLSAVVAIVLTPALCATMLKPIDHHKAKRGPAAWFNRNFDRATGGYVSSIGYLLKRPLRVMLMFAVVIGSMSWFFLRLPSSFLPQEDQGVLMTIVQLPNGSTVTRTEEIIKKIEDYYLDKEKDAIQDVFSVSGFSFVGSGQNYALVFAKLKDFELRKDPQLAAPAVVQRAMGTSSLCVMPRSSRCSRRRSRVSAHRAASRCISSTAASGHGSLDGGLAAIDAGREPERGCQLAAFEQPTGGDPAEIPAGPGKDGRHGSRHCNRQQHAVDHLCGT